MSKCVSHPSTTRLKVAERDGLNRDIGLKNFPHPILWRTDGLAHRLVNVFLLLIKIFTKTMEKV